MKDKLLKLFEEKSSEYKSIPFWSWNNSLDEGELVRQIEEMHSFGIGGFIMHARLGMKDEYLGDKWFSCVEACLNKAKQLGMEAWIYDENGWPSGFVGGKLLENEAFRARFLEYEIGEWDDGAYASFVEDEENGFIYLVNKTEGVERYHKVYLRVSPANTDILNPAVTDAFIEQTHEQYYSRFKESFGKELVGFFTDEPQYYRWATPYTPVVEGYIPNVRENLIWLFNKDGRGHEFRYKYYSVLNELYVNNFYKKLYEWCEAHNCKLTGHSVEEPSLYTQMWGGGAVMPSYEFEHIPGIDCLGRFPLEEVSPKQVGSVSAQLDKKVVLTETFACSGYDATPYELKSVGDAQYFHGVNKLCHHLYPYSIAGQGRVDHPPVFGAKSNWGEGFKQFNEYFTRLGTLIGETEECVDIAVLHPMRSIWLDYIRNEDYASIKEQEDKFVELIVNLRKHGVTYHFIDEQILKNHGSTDGKTVKVGSRKYDCILIPEALVLASSTYKLLSQYSGNLCVLGGISKIDGKKAEVNLRSNITLEDIYQKTKIPFSCPCGKAFVTSREGSVGEFVFVKNLSVSEPCEVIIKGASENYFEIDLLTLEEKTVDNSMTIPQNGSKILVKGKAKKDVFKPERIEDVTDNFKVAKISPNYLVMDYAQIAREGEDFGKRYPTTGLFDELLRENYKGKITVRHTFVLEEKMPLTLIMERAELIGATLNGVPITFEKGDFDVNFVEANVTGEVRKGENEFVYSFEFFQHDGVQFALFDPMATESLRNCLYYDTSISPCYLRGDFVVGKNFSLSSRESLPKIGTDMYLRGYPFFKGELTLEGEVCKKPNEEITLQLDGRFVSAEVSVEGKKLLCSFDGSVNIGEILTDGVNKVKIVLRSSLRNLFGPFHFKSDGDSVYVWPGLFDFRAEWQNGYPVNYTDEYMSVPFGINKIKAIKR